LPIITEEDNNYLKNGPTIPYKTDKGNSLTIYEEMKSARSSSMLSVAPSRESDGIIVPTKMSKKGDTSTSLLGQLRYAQCIQFSKLPTFIMKFSADFQYLATGGQD